VPSWTFIATPHALSWQDITPVFADIDPQTHNLDPDAVRRMITSITNAGTSDRVDDVRCSRLSVRCVDELHAVGQSARRRVLVNERRVDQQE